MENASEILRRAKVAVSNETFTFVSLVHGDFTRLTQNPELSPRMSSPFMILKDAFEVTLLLDENDFGTMRHALRDAKVMRGYRLVTFDVDLGPEVVGFMAEITRILADASVPIIALSAFSRDHLLARQQDLAHALKKLGPHIGELC